MVKPYTVAVETLKAEDELKVTVDEPIPPSNLSFAKAQEAVKEKLNKKKHHDDAVRAQEEMERLQVEREHIALLDDEGNYTTDDQGQKVLKKSVVDRLIHNTFSALQGQTFETWRSAMMSILSLCKALNLYLDQESRNNLKQIFRYLQYPVQNQYGALRRMLSGSKLEDLSSLLEMNDKNELKIASLEGRLQLNERCGLIAMPASFSSTLNNNNDQAIEKLKTESKGADLVFSCADKLYYFNSATQQVNEIPKTPEQHPEIVSSIKAALTPSYRTASSDELGSLGLLCGKMFRNEGGKMDEAFKTVVQGWLQKKGYFPHATKEGVFVTKTGSELKADEFKKMKSDFMKFLKATHPGLEIKSAAPTFDEFNKAMQEEMPQEEFKVLLDEEREQDEQANFGI